jgi:hypothetical protein
MQRAEDKINARNWDARKWDAKEWDAKEWDARKGDAKILGLIRYSNSFKRCSANRRTEMFM